MQKEINLNGRNIYYILEYKKVKNINLRIKTDGNVYVSASKFVSRKYIEEFLISKSDFIVNALEKFEKRTEKSEFFSEEELRKVITDLCNNIYPYFETMGISYPIIKFRKMKSQWGNCYHKRGILTFSTNLMYTPIECIEYVVAHEFTHFIVSNHSKHFYDELSVIMPDWKRRRQILKEISINTGV